MAIVNKRFLRPGQGEITVRRSVDILRRVQIRSMKVKAGLTIAVGVDEVHPLIIRIVDLAGTLGTVMNRAIVATIVATIVAMGVATIVATIVAMGVAMGGAKVAVTIAMTIAVIVDVEAVILVEMIPAEMIPAEMILVAMILAAIIRTAVMIATVRNRVTETILATVGNLISVVIRVMRITLGTIVPGTIARVIAVLRTEVMATVAIPVIAAIRTTAVAIREIRDPQVATAAIVVDVPVMRVRIPSVAVTIAGAAVRIQGGHLLQVAVLLSVAVR